jgi:tRNA pseudouridine38-40 synthase
MPATPLWARLGGEFPPHGLPLEQPEPLTPPGQPRHLALVLAYDGQGWAGWQLQPGRPTLQEAVESVLGRLCGQPVRVAASGRTDAGVHALGQVASFATTSALPLPRLLLGLGALLPPGVLARAVGPMPPDFHARYSAQAKTYDYYLWPRAGTAGLFLRDRLWALERPLDPGPVRRALELLPGERDLKALASRGHEAKGSTRRDILEAKLDVWKEGPWRVRLTATGFLRHVVRNLLGVLSQVGEGRLAPENLMEMLEAGRRLYPGPKAPPQGLYLNRVYYQPWPGPAQD